IAARGGARGAAFGDLDGDGRTDLFIASDSGSALLLNGGAQRFRDATAAAGLPTAAATAVAVGDYNNDGYLDLFIGGTGGSPSALWLNQGSGTFVRDRRSRSALDALRSLAPDAAEFVDYDNDGWLDLLVVGGAAPGARIGSGVLLLHNDGSGRFVDRSSALPASVRGDAASVAITDIEGDGDEDLFIADAHGSVHLVRNDGGNQRLAARVKLNGLRTGSGKNNDFGIGSRIELRAGDLYQTRVVTSRVTHFGLGPHLKADVVRVEWTNGVPQTIYLPGTDQDVLESELLKGSCAFLYTWDGTAFRFVTDVM